LIGGFEGTAITAFMAMPITQASRSSELNPERVPRYFWSRSLCTMEIRDGIGHRRSPILVRGFGRNRGRMGSEPEANLICSFCGKSQAAVRKLIAGPTVYICDECIDLCNDIIAEETGVQHRERPHAVRFMPLLCAFFFGALITYFFMR
jgi:hypothetical protein